MSTLYYLLTLYLRGVRIPLLLPRVITTATWAGRLPTWMRRPSWPAWKKQKKTGRFVQFELSLGGFGDLYNQESYVKIQNSMYIYIYYCIFMCVCVTYIVICMYVCLYVVVCVVCVCVCMCVCVRASIYLSSVCLSLLYATYVSMYVSMHVSVPGFLHLFLDLSMHLSASVSIHVALRFTECVSM